MAYVEKLRLMYRLVFFCFCVIFACAYHGDTSDNDRREFEAKCRKLKEEFKGKSLNTKYHVRLKRDKYASRSTGNLKIVGGGAQKKDLKISSIIRGGK